MIDTTMFSFFSTDLDYRAEANELFDFHLHAGEVSSAVFQTQCIWILF